MGVTESIWRLDLGATVIDSNCASFKVWAPERDSLSVRIVSGTKPRQIPLHKTAQGYFSGVAEDVGARDLYVYVLDGNNHYPDPASRFQPDGVHGPSQVTDPGEFLWDDDGWGGMALQDFIIYELHVGTFTGEGTFEAIIPYLGYLTD